MRRTHGQRAQQRPVPGGLYSHDADEPPSVTPDEEVGQVRGCEVLGRQVDRPEWIVNVAEVPRYGGPNVHRSGVIGCRIVAQRLFLPHGESDAVVQCRRRA